MKMLLQTLESPCLLGWAGFDGLYSVFVTN